MAKKSKNASQVQNGGVGPRQVDPPIIVGGGGSVTVDFKTSPTTINPSPGYARRHRLPNDIVRILISDGMGKIHDHPLDPAKFVVNFRVD